MADSKGRKNRELEPKGKEKGKAIDSKVEDDFDLDAFLEKNDFLPKEDKKPGKDTESSSDTETKPSSGTETKTPRKRKRNTENADPNATLSYDALGVDYPEIPLVNEETDKDKEAAEERKVVARKASTRKTPRSTPKKNESAKAAPVERDNAPTSSASTTAGKSTGRSRTGKTPAVRKQASSSSAARTSANSSPAARASAGSSSAAKTPTSSKRTKRQTSLADPKDFRSAEIADSSYRIRGGGKRHNRLGPVMATLIAVVVIAGIGLSGYGLSIVWTNLFGDKPADKVVILSAEQARDAIDSEMPELLQFIGLTPEEARASFAEWGWNVIPLERLASDNPDDTATGDEMVHLDDKGTVDTLEGYKAGEFSAYDFDQLQTSFNGAWSLDLSAGDKGRYTQLKYVNFAAISLEHELDHLRTQQGLADSESSIDSEGEDAFGNTFIQGYTVTGETTYYWKLIGITFNDYYRGQDKRKLPDSSVFVKCTLATFDFYGATSLKTEGEAVVDESAAEEEAPAEEGEEAVAEE